MGFANKATRTIDSPPQPLPLSPLWRPTYSVNCAITRNVTATTKLSLGFNIFDDFLLN